MSELSATSTKKRANDLDGKAWIRASISLWDDIAKNTEERTLAKKHPALFPAALASRLISMYSRIGDLVYDPFCGIGSTLVAARALGRQSIGTELSPEFARLASDRLAQIAFPTDEAAAAASLIQADAHWALSSYFAPDSIDLVVTSPPYWDILLAKKRAGHKGQRGDYGNTEGDLGKIADYTTFLESLYTIFSGVYRVLKPGGYACVNVMDLRKKQVFYPLHSDLSELLRSRLGFLFWDIIIWDRRREYNALGPIGYPTTFLINKVHEYILVFRKPLE